MAEYSMYDPAAQVREIEMLKAEVERLKADLNALSAWHDTAAQDLKGQSKYIAKQRAKIEAALALEPFERWQDCDDLVVSHAELVEALEGGREK